MMEEWFQHNLIDLLPPLYADADEDRDLQTFLSLPAETLDELKASIDRLPGIFDVDRCDERFLPLLAYLVGHTYDGTDAPNNQRRLIRESIEIYRRKGTLPAMDRSLSAIGWEGNIEETFRRALRLNARSRLNAARLPGQVFSLGAYRVHSFNLAEGVREALSFHHPAGTRAFFLQWLASFIELTTDLKFENAAHIRRVALAFLDDTFVLGRSQLGSCDHLTNKQQVFNVLQLTSTVEMAPEIDRAANKVSRFHGRQDRLRLNAKRLNRVKTPNLSVREDRLSFCNPIYTGRNYRTDIAEAGFRLSENYLNQRKIPFAEAEVRYCFRQKDIFSVLQAESSLVLSNQQVLEIRCEANAQPRFKLGQSPLNREILINSMVTGTGIRLIATVACQGEVTEATDLLNRWCSRKPSFGLNANTLNGRRLSNVNLTEERATLEVYTNTDFNRARVSPMSLNQRALNTTALRLSVDRSRPLKVSRAKLNQSGFRRTEPGYRWLFRQRDLNDEHTASVESATNQYTVTKWPA
ncbi:phage tail protein [Pontiellaceae bacterium B12219]|nr:phage tail protein [Pontiellaceae bacterium B12219]